MRTVGVSPIKPENLVVINLPAIKRPARRIGAKSRRGFAAMSPEQQRRIASEGGRASHESGRGHRFSAEEAREAGRKGGKISRRGKQTTDSGKA